MLLGITQDLSLKLELDNMPYDILQGVQYDPRYDDQVFSMIADETAKKNEKFNQAYQTTAEAEANIGSIPVVSPDVNYLNKTLEGFKNNVEDLVKNKYAGDYGAASKEIVRNIAQTQPIISNLKRRYDEYQKILPTLTELRAKKQLIETPELQQALTSPTYNEQGQLNIPTYKPIARPDYWDIVYRDIGKTMDQMVVEGKLQPTEKWGYLQTISEKGLNAIDNEELKSRIEKYVPEFEAKTPFNIDPLMQEQYKGDTKRFIEDALRSMVSKGEDRHIIDDFMAKLQYEDAMRKKKAQSDLSDIYVFGPKAQDTVENTFLDTGKSVTEGLNITGMSSKDVDVKKVKKELNDKLEQQEEGLRVASDPKSVNPYNKSYMEGLIKITQDDLDKINSIEPILEKNKDLFKMKMGRDPKSDYELAQFIDQDSEAVKREYTVTRPILNPLTSKMLKTTVKEMTSPNFRVENENINARSLGDISKKIGVNESVIREVLDSEEYNPRYNKVSGEYYINIPTNAAVNKTTGKLAVDSKTNYKKLYFSPDEPTAEYSMGLKAIKNAVASGDDKPLSINPTGDILSYVYNPSYKGLKTDKDLPRIDVYDRRSGSPLLDRNGNKVVFSINDLEDHIEKLNEMNLKSEYTYKWLPLRQQNKVEY